MEEVEFTEPGDSVIQAWKDVWEVVEGRIVLGAFTREEWDHGEEERLKE